MVTIHPTTPAEQTRTTKLTCEERAKLMRERLHAAQERPHEPRIDWRASPPSVPTEIGKPLPEGPMVSLVGVHTILDGQLAYRLSFDLNHKRELWKSLHKQASPPQWNVVVNADMALPAKRLVRTSNALRAEGWTPWLVVRLPDAPRVPHDGPAWLGRLLEQHRAGTITTHDMLNTLKSATEHGMSMCEPLKAAVGDRLERLTEYADPAETAPKLNATPPEAPFAAYPNAIALCKCSLDVDTFEAVQLILHDRARERYRVIAPPREVGSATTVRELVLAQ